MRYGLGMDEFTPLWALIANCFVGVTLLLWVLATLPFILAGVPPLVGGGLIALPALAIWAVWNGRSIMRTNEGPL